VSDNKASGRATIKITTGTPTPQNIAHTEAPQPPPARPWSDPEILRRIEAYLSTPGVRRSLRGVLGALWQPEHVSRRKLIALAEPKLEGHRKGGRPRKLRAKKLRH
jgi:hypothetical protein